MISLLLLSACSKPGEAVSGKQEGGSGGGGGKKGGRKGGGGDAPVQVAKSVRKTIPTQIQIIGNVEAYATIAIRAQVTGQVTTVHFSEGDFVKKGALLFNIDSRPFEATLNQALANAARDEATLSQAQANLARDTATAKYQEGLATRYNQLYQGGVISKDQSEQLRANAEAIGQAVAADRAAVDSAKAAIGASRAAVENARVQLGYTTIRSPLDGRTGNLTVKQGNLVTANNMDMITVNQVEPIYVTFSVPETQLPAIRRRMAQEKLPVRAVPQDSPQGQAGVAGEPEIGYLTFIDNFVDATTGAIKMKATFPNKNHRLWPGQFVRVTLQIDSQPNAVVVPNQAVQTGQEGTFVYVVKQDRTVENRPVVTGSRVEEETVIAKGLEEGETVVTEGQLRLVPGSHVTVRDASGQPLGRGGRGGEAGRGAGKAPEGRGGQAPEGRGGPGGRKGGDAAKSRP